MQEFKEAKDLLDEINTAISGYDPILKEQARDILLKATFGWENQGKTAKDRELHKESQILASDFGSDHRRRSGTLGDYARTWLPRTGADRALLSLYYLKKELRLKSPTGYQIATELRENGMPLANISVAMHENVKHHRAESRVIRGKKGTRQSRNEYAITGVGIQYIESRFDLDYDHRRITPVVSARTYAAASPETTSDQMIGIRQSN